ncbi:MAG: hypothetical protein ACKPJD_25345, partial [Planctomycetaceae bacterium]
MAASCLTSLQQLNPLQRFVFDSLCLLGHAAIPERLLRARHPDAVSGLPAELQPLLPRRPEDVLLPVYAFCLAERPYDAERLLNIHNVIQDATRRWQRELPAEEQSQRRRFAEALVQADFVRPETTANETLNILPELRQLQPHVTELCRLPLVPPLFLARCSRVLGHVHWTVGQNTAALEQLTQATAAARAACHNQLPQSALELAKILNLYIFVRNAMGDRDGLLESCSEVLELTSAWGQHAETEYCEAWASSRLAAGRVYESLGDLA